MANNQGARPSVDLKKDAEEFRAKFDEDIKECINFLDAQLTALICDPESIRGSVSRKLRQDALVDFSKAKHNVLISVISLINQKEREWSDYMSEMKKLFVENVEILLAGTKLEVKLPPDVQLPSPRKSHGDRESMSMASCLVTNISETIPGTENTADENIELLKLYRNVQSILNKLTPQTFETLVEHVKTFDIDTEEKLFGVVDLVYEKAINEPNFTALCAKMCKHLALICVPLDGQPGKLQFRKILLTKCQKDFEEGRQDEIKRKVKIKAIEAADPEKRKKLQMEFDKEEKKIRMRNSGNIRFIGELFKLKMLIEPIIHECIKELLSQSDEESLECLCHLLTTVGKELDAKGSKRKGPNPMDQYFAQMQEIVDKCSTSSGVRFMLQDVIVKRKVESVSQNRVVLNSDISIEEIKAKLNELLGKDDENYVIFDWIDANVPSNKVSEPAFIRALSQEVHIAPITDKNGETYELNHIMLKRRIPLLTKYIGHNKKLELQALYAVQHLMNHLNQPKRIVQDGVVRQIFDVLYENDVITEETFKLWRQCKDPTELEGKEVALLSARGFFACF